MSNIYDDLFKLIIIGDTDVGKSSIITRYTSNKFNNISLDTTIGIDFKIKILNLDDRIIKLHIWDTAGQERYRTITNAYYNGVHGILLVYDVNNINSLNNITRWIDDINKSVNKSKSIAKIIIGNKIDIQHDDNILKVATNLAMENKIDLVFTSAKNGQGVDDLFYKLINDIIKNTDNQVRQNELITLDINKNNKKCCF